MAKPILNGVTLDTGEQIPADLALVGLDVKPATDAISGLPCNDDGSVSVDAQLRVADALLTAGGRALHASPIVVDGPAIRVEHWRVAQQHGRTAALAMMGKPVRYDAVPVFWIPSNMRSELDYMAGHAAEWERNRAAWRPGEACGTG